MGKINFKRAAAKAVGVSAGAIGALKFGSKLPIADKKIKGGLMIVAGALISEYAASSSKGMVGEIGEGVGLGVVAIGATQLYHGLTASAHVGDVYGDDDEMSGMYGDDDEMSGVYGDDDIEGFDDDEMSGVHGDDDIQGFEDELDGFDDDEMSGVEDDLQSLDGVDDEPIIEGHGRHGRKHAPHRHRHDEEEMNDDDDDVTMQESDDENAAVYGADDEEVFIN